MGKYYELSILFVIWVLKFWNLIFFFRDVKETDNNLSYKSCESSELAQVQCLENVHLTFNLEAGLLLPFVVK